MSLAGFSKRGRGFCCGDDDSVGGKRSVGSVASGNMVATPFAWIQSHFLLSAGWFENEPEFSNGREQRFLGGKTPVRKSAQSVD